MATEEFRTEASLSGQMYLYKKPEILNKEHHGSLGFAVPERPFDHVKSARVIPLTLTEFGSAQRHYPVVFSGFENPVPLAVLGVLDDTNLFVDENGQWDPMCYLPSYLRCHPFAFAAEREGRLAVIVDREAASVSEDPTFPFFTDGEISEHTQTLMRFCATYEGERKRTVEFCEKLAELGLFVANRSTHTPEGAEEPTTLADYVSVDVEKLNELDADTVHDLHKSGFLSAIYLQLYSLENWRHLMARRVAGNLTET